jgi:hypothetical protein
VERFDVLFGVGFVGSSLILWFRESAVLSPITHFYFVSHRGDSRKVSRPFAVSEVVQASAKKVFLCERGDHYNNICENETGMFTFGMKGVIKTLPQPTHLLVLIIIGLAAGPLEAEQKRLFASGTGISANDVRGN